MLSNLSKAEEEALRLNYEALFKIMAKSASDKGTAALAARNDIERRYGRAYQQLVKAGLVMQIKKKYRSY
jgi:hypothetical protein